MRKCETPPLRIRAQQIKMKHNDIAVGNYGKSLEQVGSKLKIARPELEARQAVDVVMGSTDYYTKYGMGGGCRLGGAEHRRR